ncbi:MAG: ATP-binding cassette domain-containing protein [Thermoplasmata archaeon]|nr:ATP-binding cassette domain-containing protein [Thermoplasmata archaeon]
MIELKNITVEVPSFKLENINLTIDDGEYFILLGPTGSGKSLLLDTIAGSIYPEEGEIIIDGKNITEIQPEKRNVGYVPQDYSLFDHMKVLDNIIFGLKVRGKTKEEAIEIVQPIIKKLSIENLLNKYPYVLSGGEKQKVAIARALAIKPKILLLDEPLTGMDQNLRARFMEDLKKIHEDINLTTLQVTHSMDEARYLATRVGILNSGKIEQVGLLDEIMVMPKSEFVASFLGLENIISNQLINNMLKINKNSRIAFRPYDVIVSDDGIALEIENFFKVPEGIKITGFIGDDKISIILDKIPDIRDNKIKIKIKKFSIIQD